MKLHELLDEELEILNAPMCEMANLYPKSTGVGVVMWFGEVGGQHGPRVKVSNVPGKFRANDCFVVSVDKEPRVLTPKSMRLKQAGLDDVTDWIRQNYDDLMLMWKINETGDETVEDHDGSEVSLNQVLMRLKKI